MFEYLMPLLVMPTYPGTLLDETYRRRGRAPDAVRRAARRAVGHLRVGLQRAGPRQATTSTGRSACPASASSAGWPTIWWSRRTRPCSRRRSRRATCSATRAAGARRRWPAATAIYEAIDYTPIAARRARDGGVVLPTYMAHHQGMSLLALDNAAATASRCSGGFMPIRASRRPSCCCRSGSRSLVPLKNPPLEVADHVPVAARPRRDRSVATPRRTR